VNRDDRDRELASEVAESISLLCCEDDVDKLVAFAKRARDECMKLLDMATCKNTGCDGYSYPVQVGEGCQQEQCQWHDEMRRLRQPPARDSTKTTEG